MKSKLLLLMVCVALALTACGRVPDTPTSAPAEPTTAPPAPTTGATTVPIAPTDTPPATVEPTPIPTTAPAASPTSAPSETPTAEATVAPRPRPTATATPASSGLLDFQFYLAVCKPAPTAEKPGNVVLTISVEAAGGNGVYRYFFRDAEEPDKFIDVSWDRGTSVNGKVTVTSGDGQVLEREFFFAPADFNCP